LSLILEFPWNSSTSFDTINSIKRSSFVFLLKVTRSRSKSEHSSCMCAIRTRITLTHTQICIRHLILFIVTLARFRGILLRHLILLIVSSESSFVFCSRLLGADRKATIRFACVCYTYTNHTNTFTEPSTSFVTNYSINDSCRTKLELLGKTPHLRVCVCEITHTHIYKFCLIYLILFC